MAKFKPNFLFVAVTSAVLFSSVSPSFAAQSDAAAAKADGQSVTEDANKSMGNDSARECIGQRESGGDYSAENKEGYLGKFQIGEAKLIDTGWATGAGGVPSSNDNRNIVWSQKAIAAGVNSRESFLANQSVQEQAKTDIDNWNSNRLNSSKSTIGKSMDCSAYGGSASTPISETMLIQGAQLGHGKVNYFSGNGGNCIAGKGTPTNDGNGTCVKDMMCTAANCSSVTKDMSKQTCSVTMPMIKAISCANFTGANLALCNAAQPYLMTDGECNAAEAMSEAAPKGPNKEKCENSTFGPGSGSWSYALACSWASEAVADQDGANNPSPMPGDDPQCIAKLRSMGVEFTERGQRQNGSYRGKACMINSSVSSSGTALPFGANLEMDCNLLLTTEIFSQKLKALGVTSYYGVSSTVACRGIRNSKTADGGTVSFHSLGKAFDYSGVMVGNKKISMGLVNEPGTAGGQFALQIKAIACATFSGVLSPTWANYKNTYFHNHVDVGGHYCK